MTNSEEALNNLFKISTALETIRVSGRNDVCTLSNVMNFIDSLMNEERRKMSEENSDQKASKENDNS